MFFLNDFKIANKVPVRPPPIQCKYSSYANLLQTAQFATSHL